MLTRKIGKLIRGNTTPFQIFSASLLGACLGCLPGFSQVSGLVFLLGALLVVVNANLFIATIVGLGAKIVYLLALPLLFRAGVWLLEGPFSGIFAFLANAPITAWFGFEHYVVPSGIVLGIVLGVIIGWLITRQVQAIRSHLAQLDAQSEKFQKWSNHRWIKIFAFVFIGGTKGKKSWEELLRPRVGNPIRPIGAVLVGLTVILIWISLMFLDTLILTETTRSALERVNGATVDLERVEFDPTSGRLEIHSLAMADPDQLDRNIFQAETVTADISNQSLLTRKFVIDEIVAIGAENGYPRTVPGKKIGPKPKPPSDSKTEIFKGKPLEEYIGDAAKWKERLSQISKWVEKFSPESKPDDTEASGDPGKVPLSWRQRIQLEAEQLGYENVTSDSLIRKSPRLLVRSIRIEDIRTKALENDRIHLSGNNISTHPGLVDDAPQIRVRSGSGSFDLQLSAGALSSSSSAYQIDFTVRNLSAGQIAARLKDPDRFPVKEGTFEATGSGNLYSSVMDLPLTVTIKSAKVVLPKFQPIDIASLELPLSVSGPLGSPRIHLEADAFRSAVTGAAKGKLKEAAESKLEEAVGKDKVDKLKKMLPFGQ